MVSHLTGLAVQRNKAIIGENAFAHEAGIHQDGMIKHRSTYEIMDPREVGIPESKLVLGKHSGRHAFRQRITDLGYTFDDATLGRAFEAMGQGERAVKYYQQAAAFEDNPVRWDAEEAIRRVRDRNAPSEAG